jgi:hypothetical protein
MKRNKIALLGIFFISCGANAWEAGWAGHWLLGASAGYGNRSGSAQTAFGYNGTLFPATFPQSLNIHDYGASGLIWGIFTGYQAVKQSWLIGAEVNIDRHEMNEDLNFAFTDTNRIIGWTGSTNYKRDLVLGLTGRAGYAITPFFLTYVRLGVEFGHDKLTTDYVGNPSAYPYGIGVSTTTYVHRALSGFGFEIPLPMTCDGSFRMEYNWHSKSKTLKANGYVIDGLVSPAFESSLQPQTHSGRVALVWNFSR